MSASFAQSNAYRLGPTSQTISCTTASTGATNPFGSTTFSVRLSVSGSGATHFRIGDGTQTATTSDPYLPNTMVERVIVSPGQKIAAITESGTSTLVVTELTT